MDTKTPATHVITVVALGNKRQARCSCNAWRGTRYAALRLAGNDRAAAEGAAHVREEAAWVAQAEARAASEVAQ